MANPFWGGVASLGGDTARMFGAATQQYIQDKRDKPYRTAYGEFAGLMSKAVSGNITDSEVARMSELTNYLSQSQNPELRAGAQAGLAAQRDIRNFNASEEDRALRKKLALAGEARSAELFKRGTDKYDYEKSIRPDAKDVFAEREKSKKREDILFNLKTLEARTGIKINQAKLKDIDATKSREEQVQELAVKLFDDANKAISNDFADKYKGVSPTQLATRWANELIPEPMTPDRMWSAVIANAKTAYARNPEAAKSAIEKYKSGEQYKSLIKNNPERAKELDDILNQKVEPIGPPKPETTPSTVDMSTESRLGEYYDNMKTDFENAIVSGKSIDDALSNIKEKYYSTPSLSKISGEFYSKYQKDRGDIKSIIDSVSSIAKEETSKSKSNASFVAAASAGYLDSYPAAILTNDDVFSGFSDIVSIIRSGKEPTSSDIADISNNNRPLSVDVITKLIPIAKKFVSNSGTTPSSSMFSAK